MKIYKSWEIKETQTDERITDACNGNLLLSKLLLNRGINTEEKVRNFLNPMKAPLSSPDVFTDMEKACERIKKSIDSGEKITVYGDFDADGITSTALLYITLKHIGANVDYYLPDRATESHGLNTRAIVKLISKNKTKLIITVDCGISNINEVNFANGFKTDVIITDHHEAPEILPNAFAIINPKANNSIIPNLEITEIESLNYLAGAGVSFKLACKLLDMFNKQDFVHEILPLSAIGTIGDIVELIGENRSIVSMGLELIKNGRNQGIQELLKTSGLTNISQITSENIAFSIVPRINAAGRLESPETAIKVLTENDPEITAGNVKILNDLNTLRQELCEETFNEAVELYNKTKNNSAIILFNENWHIGIIGIVASKLVETYNKPSLLMTKDANHPNIIRCSCRSIEGINIHTVLSQHKELFEGFGGHKMAAGLSFDETKIKFDDLKNILEKSFKEASEGLDTNKIKIYADMELDIENITPELTETIKMLEPFGTANPSPLFVMKNLKLQSIKFMGQNNNHLKIFANKNSSNNIECIKWNTSEFDVPINSDIDILFFPRVNEFNGNTTIQLILNDVHSEYIKYKKEEKNIKILDHRNKKNILTQVLDFLNTTKKDTGIYVENDNILKKLNIADEIKEKIFNLKNIPDKKEQLMFFDCPNALEDFFEILKKTEPEIIHLMNFGIEEINVQTLITKLSGMIKYAIKNLQGETDIERVAKALNVDNETIECAINLLENENVISIKGQNENICTISDIKIIELSKLKENELYSILEENLKNTNLFKDFYVNAEYDEIKEKIISGIGE